MIMGMNAIAVYLCSEFLITILEITHWKEAIYNAVFAPLASPINASFLFAITYSLLHLLLAYLLYRRNWFLKV
jgi:predicted acyltransferase